MPGCTVASLVRVAMAQNTTTVHLTFSGYKGSRLTVHCHLDLEFPLPHPLLLPFPLVCLTLPLLRHLSRISNSEQMNHINNALHVPTSSNGVGSILQAAGSQATITSQQALGQTSPLVASLFGHQILHPPSLFIPPPPSTLPPAASPLMRSLKGFSEIYDA
ncbi:hypothetical protein CTheo_48 [Ceratobasidium theobromae]|uniref:Uncharacterized protein n=1 Tax=Ceratobasidium theobromae TaxID=1582974 RepID=A0A5N5QXS9_9AGAM|nr:hypothetical protein CTheo_48 [Ceratobasidium theobromae]